MQQEKSYFEVIIGIELSNCVKIMVLEDGRGLGTDGNTYTPITELMEDTDQIKVVGWTRL